MTCLSRAISSLETDLYLKTDDSIAFLLIPPLLKPLLRAKLIRRLFTSRIAPDGIYAYVIARTKYIDAAFEKALLQQFDQILIFGAGFDTRALRFGDRLGTARVWELDAAPTQQAKLQRYKELNLTVPENVQWIAIDFDHESLPAKLHNSGFESAKRSLFVLEGLIMYLQAESVDAAFGTISEFSGAGSRVVFDYVVAAVLRNEGRRLGQSRIARTVSKAGEQWQFGLDVETIEPFLDKYGFALVDHRDSQALEKTYFSDAEGKILKRVNATHCLVTAERR
jgi:methyltransferase (TIGR00027 family)